MKANELMIGDWVYCNQDGCKGHQVDLIDLGNEEIGVDGELLPFDMIKPIPITLEILEKNGFTNDELSEKALQNIHHSHKTIHHFTSEDRRVSVCDNDEWLNSNNTWFVHVDTEDMRTMATIELTYVHELQHILKHCGVEKEIEL